MENLLKQARKTRRSKEEEKKESRPLKLHPSKKTTNNTRHIPEEAIPLIGKAAKENNKRPQNWFLRQFSGQMNQDYDSDRAEQAIAVAAAVYAIVSSNASSIPEEKKIRKESESSLTRTKSKKEDSTDLISETGESSMRSPEIPTSREPETASDEKTTREIAVAAPPIKRTPTFTDRPAPSMKKTPTFADKSLNSTIEKKPEIAEQMKDTPTIKSEIPVKKLDLPPPTKPTTPPSKIETQISTQPGAGETPAAAWERAELAKIQKRYEQTIARILSWEDKKKAKSRSRLNKTEGDLELLRDKALRQFRKEMEDINSIAGGARAKAEERQRNEQFKAKEKANSIRKTGKPPRTCFCF